MSIIKAKDVGRLILNDLREAAIKSMPNATEAEREESLAKFLGVWSGQMFMGPENAHTTKEQEDDKR